MDFRFYLRPSCRRNRRKDHKPHRRWDKLCCRKGNCCRSRSLKPKRLRLKYVALWFQRYEDNGLIVDVIAFSQSYSLANLHWVSWARNQQIGCRRARCFRGTNNPCKRCTVKMACECAPNRMNAVSTPSLDCRKAACRCKIAKNAITVTAESAFYRLS